MLRRLLGSLRLRLLIVIILSILPIFGLISRMLSEERSIELEEARRDATRLARLAANEHERVVQGTQQLLTVISRLPQLTAPDPDMCCTVFTELMKQYQYYAELGLYSPDGQPVCIVSPRSSSEAGRDSDSQPPVICTIHNPQARSASEAPVRTIPVASASFQKYVRKAAKTKQIVIGEVFARRDSDRPTIILTCPALDSNYDVQLVLTAVLDLSWMSRLVSLSNLQDGSFILILNRSGRVFFRFPESDPQLSEAIPIRALTSAIAAHNEGTTEIVCPDDHKRSFAFVPLQGLEGDSTLHLAVGIPASVVYARIDRIMPGSIVALAALLVLAAAWIGSAVALLRPLSALTGATRKLAQGDLSVRTGIAGQPGEINQLAQAFDEMAETIEERQAQLYESEARYRMLVEQIPAITYTASLGENTRFTYVSPQVETMLGFSRQEWISDRALWEKQIHPQDYQRVMEEVVKARRMCRPFVSEYRIFAGNGRMVWLRDEAVLVSDDLGNVLSSQGVMLDITEHKHAEETVYTANKTLRTLSECNQALVRATDEIGLLNRICEIIVEEGGYHMAWVGYAEQDAEKSVRPMSWAGHSNGYVENADIRWADVPLGRGPVGNAIRTGQVYTVKDVLNDPAFGPWRQPALQRGYASTIALPLFESGRVFGALMIYSKQTNAFGSEEVKLLAELAEDLAYGVSALRTRDERYRAETSLRESEGRYRAVVEAFDGYLYICSSDLRIEFMNNQLIERTGYDAIGKPCYQAIHDLDSVCPWCVSEYVLQGESVRWECCSPKDNRWYYIVSTPINHSNGSVSQQAMIIDITDRKQAEDALKESERYFRSILFSMNEDILVIDPGYFIRDVNKDELLIISRRKADVLGHRCHEVLKGYPEPCEVYSEECMLRSVFETGEPRTCRKEILRADSGRIWVDILFSPLKDEHNRTTHVIEAVRDVTNEIELESRLRQAQKMEAIGTLAGGIAHDFNNILTVIIGYAEIMLIDTPGGTQDFDNLEQILMAGHRAKDLVNQILAFSRQSEHELRPLRISPIVKEVIKLLRAAMPSTIGIRLSISIPPEKGDTVLADPTQIHQLLMNLCTNAGHAMREKGGTLEVILSIMESEPGPADMSLELQHASHLKLEVSDTGHGMDEATLERIFEPYFTTKRAGEGTGLGLAVVHGIVKSHNGAITAWSEPSKGTRFTIYLPLTERPPQLRIDESTEEVAHGSERILFVDDEPALISWAGKVLERLGYEVDTTTSSLEALEAFRSDPEHYALLVTDQTMPQMTGIELAREVMSIIPDFPVILCTGFSELITPQVVKEAGIRDLIMKPLVIRTISRSIRAILDQTKEGD